MRIPKLLRSSLSTTFDPQEAERFLRTTHEVPEPFTEICESPSWLRLHPNVRHSPSSSSPRAMAAN